MKISASFFDIVCFVVSIFFAVFESPWWLIASGLFFIDFFNDRAGRDVLTVRWEKGKGWSFGDD